MYWNGWPWQRVILIFTGVAFLMIGLQVTLFHYRQNFRNWMMWVPVIATPVMGLLAVTLGFYNVPALRAVFAGLLAIGALAGAGGFVLHFEGVGERVDGYRINNFLVGPPVTLPLMVTALSVLGLIALYWRW
ncbi:MAG: hypothetical protein CVU89_07010 [Firmicutes bacterium HGW-Firmicutes-14]|nr:MAG: hypothetical protein CVU89_07010 [Firmicutes bacterium HGW-Firmicutes-14]